MYYMYVLVYTCTVYVYIHVLLYKPFAFASYGDGLVIKQVIKKA